MPKFASLEKTQEVALALYLRSKAKATQYNIDHAEKHNENVRKYYEKNKLLRSETYIKKLEQMKERRERIKKEKHDEQALLVNDNEIVIDIKKEKTKEKARQRYIKNKSLKLISNLSDKLI